MNQRTLRFAGFVYLWAVLCVAGVPARAAEDVTINLTAKRVVVGEAGKEQLTSAAEARPGDLIEYEAVYRNVSSQAVHGVQATLPIPAGMEYETNSAKPQSAVASTDGKTFRALPLTHKVKQADGSEKVELVPAKEYRALRWTISELKPGAAATVSARAKVSTASQ